MAATPKRKLSSGRQGRRRSQITQGVKASVKCKNCGQSKPAHFVCPNCGQR